MYHVEDCTHEDYRQCRASVTVQDIYSASAIALAWQRSGLTVAMYRQSHDAAPMMLVPSADWEV